MKNKEELFISDSLVGFRLYTFKDIENALDLGLEIYNEKKIRVDGKEQVYDEIIGENKLYAVFNSYHSLAPLGKTYLSSDYKVGQEVYFIRGDKIQHGKIIFMCLQEGSFYVDRDVQIKDLYCQIVPDGINKWYKLQASELSKYEKIIPEIINESFVTVLLDKVKIKISVPISKIAATIEELTKKLIENI